MSNSVWKGPFRYQLTYMGKSAGVMVSIVLLVQILFSAIAAAAEPGEPIYSNAQESISRWQPVLHGGVFSSPRSQAC